MVFAPAGVNVPGGGHCRPVCASYKSARNKAVAGRQTGVLAQRLAYPAPAAVSTYDAPQPLEFGNKITAIPAASCPRASVVTVQPERKAESALATTHKKH